jgi:hypothetical protein
MDATTQKKSSPAAIALAWALVIAPTAWGLNFTVQNALKLFTTPPAPAAAPATPAPAAH